MKNKKTIKKTVFLAVLAASFISCNDNIQETLPEETASKKDKTLNKLNVGRWYHVANLWGGPGYTKVADFNNDGRDDIISLHLSYAYLKLSNGETVNHATSQTWMTNGIYGGSSYTFAGDFNGDGYADIASAHAGTIYMKINNQNKGFTNTNWYVHNAWGGGDYTLVGDYNGDGLADIASAHKSFVYMKISRGNAFSSQTWYTDGQYGGGNYTKSGDYNGDGKDDIISLYGGTIFVKESNGTGFTSKIFKTANRWGGGDYTWMADTDNDGKDEIITAIGDVLLKREWQGGQSWSLESFYTPNIWGYNFAMDYTGDGSDEIVSAIAERLFVH